MVSSRSDLHGACMAVPRGCSSQNEADGVCLCATAGILTAVVVLLMLATIGCSRGRNPLQEQILCPEGEPVVVDPAGDANDISLPAPGSIYNTVTLPAAFHGQLLLLLFRGICDPYLLFCQPGHDVLVTRVLPESRQAFYQVFNTTICAGPDAYSCGTAYSIWYTQADGAFFSMKTSSCLI